jgi:hypothetical protein
MCYCLFAKTVSYFRQQQKLLEVVQAIESDSAHLNTAAPMEEQVLDPEVRAQADRDYQTQSVW